MNTIFKFEGSPVTFSKDESKGYMINATEMAKPFGKEPRHWFENGATFEFVEALAANKGIEPIGEIPTSLSTKELASRYPSLINVVKGGLDRQGTWLQEDVALEFARWLSPMFAIWCNDRIKELLTTGVTMMPQDYLSALKALVAAEEEKQRLASENRVMKPKADYFDDLVDRNLLTNFRDTAKELHIQQNAFIKWLTENGYIYRDKNNDIKPIAEYVTNGWFEIKEWKTDRHAGVQTLITPKGRASFKMLLGVEERAVVVSA